MGLKRYFIDGKERIFEIKSCIKNYKFKIWEVTYFNSEKAYKYSFDRIFEVDYKNDVFEYLRELSKNKKIGDHFFA